MSRIEGWTAVYHAGRRTAGEGTVSGACGKSGIRWNCFAARLNGVSPLAKLGQGYAYVSAEDGTRIRSTADVAEKSLMKIYLKDGYVKAQALEVTHGKGTDA